VFDGALAAHLGFGGAAGGIAAQAGTLLVGGRGFKEAVKLFVQLAVNLLLEEEGFQAGFQVVQQVHGSSPSRFLCFAGIGTSTTAGSSLPHPSDPSLGTPLRSG
jgi:hypothetical protein